MLHSTEKMQHEKKNRGISRKIKTPENPSITRKSGIYWCFRYLSIVGSSPVDGSKKKTTEP